jgi:hypothetical protein
MRFAIEPHYPLDERLTILREPQSPVPDAATLALAALGWVLGDGPRAERLLALMLGAVLDFLCAHEPDLVGAAGALGVDPHVLVSARESLNP